MILDAPHLAELYFDQDMVEAQERLIAGGAALVFSSRCPGKEAPNEDLSRCRCRGDNRASGKGDI